MRQCAILKSTPSTNMDKDETADDLSIEAFRLQFTNVAREQCDTSTNSSIMSQKKRDRVIRYLKNSRDEPSPRFRFWVRSKGFRIVQTSDDECILAAPPNGKDPNDTYFRRVPVTDEFFDIIYAAHCENGHVGQAQTFHAVKALYALVPRSLIVKFIEMCPQCSSSHVYMNKRRKMGEQNQDAFVTIDKLAGETAASFAVHKTEAGSLQLQEDTFDAEDHEETSEIESNSDQLNVNPTLSDLLGERVPNSDTSGDAIAAVDNVMETENSASGLVFSCHLCKEVFSRRISLQKHISCHREFRPSVPLQKTPPQRIKPGLNLSFSVPFLQTPRKLGVSRKRVILDVDASPSIAQAIFLAASRPDLDLMAINCVAGRVSANDACENALRVLRACGRDDIPVCKGAEKSLLGMYSKSENLPGYVWSRKVEGQIQTEHCVSSLIRSVNENPGEITLVCMGPLTNLALALRLDPLIATNLQGLIVTGGNIEGHGDISCCAEQNFSFDPEAAFIVLQELQDLIILPYEISMRHTLPFKNFLSWLNTGTDIAQFLADSFTQDELQQLAKTGVVCPEVFAVAMVTDQGIALEKEKLYVTVELKGDHSRGMMVVDRRGHLGKPSNAFVVKNLDLGKTQALFGALFAGGCNGANDNRSVGVVNLEVETPTAGSLVNLTPVASIQKVAPTSATITTGTNLTLTAGTDLHVTNDSTSNNNDNVNLRPNMTNISDSTIHIANLTSTDIPMVNMTSTSSNNIHSSVDLYSSSQASQQFPSFLFK